MWKSPSPKWQSLSKGCADKMPTGRNANQRLAFCPDFLLWLAFCPSQFLVGILSGPSQHVLAFCQNHEKCRYLRECEWGFVRSVDFLPYRQKANLSFCDAQITLVGHSYEANLQHSKCFEDDIRWSQRFSYVLGRFHYILSVLRLFTQKKTPKSPWVLQIWFRIFVAIFVEPLQRVRPRNGILCLVVVVVVVVVVPLIGLSS